VATYEDDVSFVWVILKGGGEFIHGNTGRYVVYEAPEAEGDVQIEVRAYNPGSMKIADQKSEAGKISFRVYKPGVKLDQTPLTWLPEFQQKLEKRSYLVYQDKGVWKDGLAHQCRIHHFDLMGVSNEPGICMNWPCVDEFLNLFPDTCPDLVFMKSDRWDRFDTTSCERCMTEDTAWCTRANSLRPEKSFTIEVASWDYGSYGFIRSTANSNRSTDGLYQSVGWKKGELKHPVVGRIVKHEYSDNRVTIPHDVDENQVADWGWTTVAQKIGGKTRVEDPWEPKSDKDNTPGNKHPGDGISAYEEYRGFYAKEKHVRLDPDIKNILLWNRDDTDLGDFSNSGIAVTQIYRNEMDTGRVINNNRKSYALGFDQKGIRLMEENLAHLGLAGKSDSIGLELSHYVYVDPRYKADKPFWRYIVPHELSHALGAWHHGEGYIHGYLPRGNSVMIDNRTGRNDTAVFAIFFIAGEAGLSSGDRNCWMRQPQAVNYCIAPGEPGNIDCSTKGSSVDITGWKIISTANKDFGRKITNHRGGTGTNANGQCGKDAATNRGNCLNQLKISMKP
jgi:hypothetical protein